MEQKFLDPKRNDSVRCVAITANGRYIALAGAGLGGKAEVWETAPIIRSLHNFPCMQGFVYAVAISEDGSRLITGGEDGTVRVWDLSQPRLIPVILRGHEGRVTGLTLSEDGKTLLSGSLDGTVRVWNLDLEYLHQRARKTAGRDLTQTEKVLYAVE